MFAQSLQGCSRAGVARAALPRGSGDTWPSALPLRWHCSYLRAQGPVLPPVPLSPETQHKGGHTDCGGRRWRPGRLLSARALPGARMGLLRACRSACHRRASAGPLRKSHTVCIWPESFVPNSRAPPALTCRPAKPSS